jgi:branched-subunit amino acid aminotransferase/4-amino-4-deoxychorismate lyase
MKNPSQVFTTAQIKDGHIYNLQRHLNRLKSSAKTIGIKYQIDEEQLKHDIKVICKNKHTNTKLKITTDGRSFELITTKLNAPINTLIGEIETKRITRRFPTAKYTTDLYQTITKERSVKIIETIFLDEQGLITEGNISNIFAIYKNEIITPPSGKCLPGIMRMNLIEFFKQKKISYKEASFNKMKLREAEEIILTNSVKGIIRVNKWENWRPKSDKVYQKLITALPFDF